MYKFNFRGGIKKVSFPRTDKFLAFAIIGGNEIPLFSLVKHGLVAVNGTEHESPYRHWKILISRRDTTFGKAAHNNHCFYVELGNEQCELTRVKHWCSDIEFYFMANIRFLSNVEASSLLEPNTLSWECARKRPSISDTIMNRIVSIERDESIRKIRARP